MSRPALRSALGRTARRALAAGARDAHPLSVPTATFFSTTPSRLADEPSRRELLAAAAAKFRSINSSKPDGSSSASAQAPSRPSANANPAFASGPGSGEGGGIIHVRSLPRKRGGSGGPGPRFPGPGVTAMPPRVITNPAFSATGNETGGRFAGMRGRGRGRGRGSGSGGPRRAMGRRRRSNDDAKEEAPKQEEPEDDMVFVRALEALTYDKTVGVETPFEPALTLEGLVGHGPAVASTQAGPRGSVETALRSMRVLSGGYAYGGNQEADGMLATATHNPIGLRSRLHNGESVFFDTADERSMVDASLHSNTVKARLAWRKMPEDTTLIAPIGEAAKEAIVDAAIRGVYAAPADNTKDTPAAASKLALYHRYQNKSYTYTEYQTREFDKKILELLPDGAGAKAAKAAKGAKA